MKTLNKNLKVTQNELNDLQKAFEAGKTLHRKINLFGSGHPQLPSLFFTKMNDEAKQEFWDLHETTHAKFKSYNSIEDIAADSDFWRSDLIFIGQEFEAWQLPCFE